jgi:hypothetical protein
MQTAMRYRKTEHFTDRKPVENTVQGTNDTAVTDQQHGTGMFLLKLIHQSFKTNKKIGQ